MTKQKMPTAMFIYKCDECDGEPIYAAANNLEEIMEEHDGEKVGIYTLTHIKTFKINRSIQ